jgi:hypothetical protein
MRLYDLPPKLLCRVLNVELKVPSTSRRLFFLFLPSPGFFAPNSAPSAPVSPPERFQVLCLRVLRVWAGGDGHRRGLRADHAHAGARGSLPPSSDYLCSARNSGIFPRN